MFASRLHYQFAFLLVNALIYVVAGVGLATADADEKRPNVILIYTDDQGSVDAGCYGAKDLLTPNIDRLAERGVRFTQFYSAAPVCSPSRAAVITGRYPQRAGLASNASSANGGHGMPTEQITMAEVFKSAGYATSHIGKWHLGYTKAEMPNAQGFDSSFGHMGGCIDNYSHFFYWNGPNRHDLWRDGKEIWRDGEFFPDMMVEEAKSFLKNRPDKPFFMYWAINTPHYPLQGTEKWRKQYADLPAPRRMYNAFVSTTDERVGELMAELEKQGLADNTIVIYQSDHGHSTEERTFGGGGSAGPYRGAKFSLFEGGIRVPAIISWPKHLPAGEVRDQMAVSIDWLPTLAELCGVKLPKSKIDGDSLVSLIQESDQVSPHEVFHWQSGRGVGGKPQWAVRRGNWKLIGHPNDTSKQAPLTNNDVRFLVDLSSDIGEKSNVAAKNPEIVKELENLHNAWLKEVQP